MPLLASWNGRVSGKLNASAGVKEASQTELCAYLSIALLIGLGANALFGLWSMDPAAALFITAVAIKGGRETWRGDGCCDGCWSTANATRAARPPLNVAASAGRYGPP
jgi:hypothetical protein